MRDVTEERKMGDARRGWVGGDVARAVGGKRWGAGTGGEGEYGSGVGGRKAAGGIFGRPVKVRGWDGEGWGETMGRGYADGGVGEDVT